MACEIKQHDLTIPGAAGFRCLYVGKGPSIVEVKVNHDWGDVAVVNDAGSYVGRHSIATFLDGSRQPHAVSQDTSLIVSPKHNHPSPADADKLLAPLWHWPHQAKLTCDAAARAIENQWPTYLNCPGPSGVLFLWLLGYRQIWLFGHDGGKNVADGFRDTGTDYSDRREVIESMVPLLAERGCEVRFWPEVF